MVRPGRSAARVSAVLASTLLAVAVAAVPASAAPVPIDRAPGVWGNLSFWAAAGFGGTAYGWRYDDPTRARCFNVPHPINNQTTAIVNKSPASFDVFDGPNCTSFMATIWPNTANDNIGAFNNDRISSFSRRS